MILWLSREDSLALRRIGDALAAIRLELAAQTESLGRIAVALEGQRPPRQVAAVAWHHDTPKQEG